MFRKLIYIVLIIVFSQHSVMGQSVWKKKIYPKSNKLMEFYQVDTISNRYNGVFKSYYKNGDIMLLGYYVYGVPIYTWKYYSEGKKVKMTANYDSLRSKNLTYRKYYYENKNVKMEGCFRDDKFEGIWKYYYPNKTLKQKGEFRNSNKVGLWVNYNSDGVIMTEVSYEKNKGHFVEYYILKGKNTGNIKKEGYLQNEIRDGEWKYYYQSGELQAKGKYNKGKRTDIWKEYYKNKQVKSEGSYDKGMKIGLWTYYYPHGKIREKGAIIDGKKNGSWELFSEEGQMVSDTNYEKGSGKYKEYYSNGVLKVVGKLKNNKSHGEWLYYYETGELKAKCLFEFGEGKYVGYYQNGKKRLEGIIKDGEKVDVWRLYTSNGKVSGYYKTIYNDDRKVQVKTNAKGDAEETNYIIPDYIKRNKKSRYYKAVTNEYRSFVISYGVPATAFGYFPINIEYYFQERLGFEFTYTFIKQPPFSNINFLSAIELKSEGHQFIIKQKFYNKDTSFGMFYFAHALDWQKILHISKIEEKNTATETIASYWFSIGSRWLKYANKSGLTIDVFGGIGIGYRQVEFNFDSIKKVTQFMELNENNIYLPIRLGVNIGIAL